MAPMGLRERMRAQAPGGFEFGECLRRDADLLVARTDPESKWAWGLSRAAAATEMHQPSKAGLAIAVVSQLVPISVSLVGSLYLSNPSMGPLTPVLAALLDPPSRLSTRRLDTSDSRR